MGEQLRLTGGQGVGIGEGQLVEPDGAGFAGLTERGPRGMEQQHLQVGGGEPPAQRQAGTDSVAHAGRREQSTNLSPQPPPPLPR